MEFALVLRELWHRRRWLVPGVAVAALLAIIAVSSVQSVIPPKLHSRALQYSTATTQVFVDTSQSSLGNAQQSLAPLLARATIYANLLATPAAVNSIGQQAGIPGSQIYAEGPVDLGHPRALVEPTAAQRNVQLTGESTPYRLSYSNDPNLPLIGIIAQAPTSAQAVALANAAAATLSQQVAATQTKLAPSVRISLRQLGQPYAAVVNSGISKKLAGIVFFAVMLAWCALVLLVVRFRANWRASAREAARLSLEATRTNGNGNGHDHSAASFAHGVVMTAVLHGPHERDATASEGAPREPGT
jgi:hypothetical protein